ncbi:MAG: hypothetical protein Q9191_000599 [Dirinaria sp. TL-2023a]
MNGAIELPGEAEPLNNQNLFRVLTNAASFNQQQVKTGAQQLQNWEKQPGFYSSLQTIFIDTSLPVEVRYLSAIQLKNGIDKYWRKTSSNAIKKDEKIVIRSRCLEAGINEPDHRLALQNALVVAKVVRFEYPNEWPEAIPSIIDSLRQSQTSPRSSSHLQRSLIMLLYVIKELSTGKLLRTKANLQSVAPEILQVLGGLYVTRVNTWRTFLSSGGDDEGGALEAIEQSLLALRVLRRLVIAGYDFPNRYNEMAEFWNVVGSHLDFMLSLVMQEQSSLHSNVQRLIERHLVQFSKLHLNMVQDHPAGFALLPSSINLARAYWALIKQFGQTFGLHSFDQASRVRAHGDADDDYSPMMETMTLKGLLLLRGCARMVFNPAQTFKYQQASDKQEKLMSRELMKADLLTDALAREMMETLVTRFFVFRPRDLREWEEEPEEWERREEGEGDVWEFSIRSCSEKLLLDLMINYKDLLVPPLLSVFQTVADPQNTDIALKDSIYAAIGLSAPILESRLDFGTFLSSTLSQEVQLQGPGYNILRRRIAIVLGQWLPVKEGLDRPLVYQIFQHLLDPDGNDQVVRVTAGRQLKNVIDPFEFTAEHFSPYAAKTITRLMILIKEVELTETKRALIDTLSVIVLKMERHIMDYADTIIQMLPPLWDAASEEYLLKQSILAILAALMTSLQSSSSKYHPLIIPLIHDSVEPTASTRVYLLEDALDLWSTLLDQTPSPSPELASLAPLLLPLYSTASETLRTALSLTESYILLIPSEILSSSTALLSALHPLLTSLKPRDTCHVTTLLELLIRLAVLTGGEPSIRSLTSAFLSTNILHTLLSSLQAAYEAHQTTGPNHTASPLDPIVEIDYLSILARLAVAGPALFLEALTAVAPTLGERFDTTINWLLTEWFSHLDNIGHPDRKKLHVLALTALYSLAAPWILSRLQELMTAWTDIVTELIDEESGNDTMVIWDIESMKGEAETAKEERSRRVAYEDVVRRVDVKVAVREAVQGVLARLGREEFEKWVENVDRDVMEAFGRLGVV